MSAEQTFSVTIPLGKVETVRRLQVSAAAALVRDNHVTAGDQTESVRYEQLQTAINMIAFAELARVHSDTLSPSEASDVTVELVWPFAIGATAEVVRSGLPKPVAQVFRSQQQHVRDADALAERFATQLQQAVEIPDIAEEQIEPVDPSGVPNEAIATLLREFYQGPQGGSPIQVPVRYRDGSPGRPLCLRSVRFADTMPADGRPVLRVSLLSVRHLTMDVEVDGAWLRNSEVSRPRPAGQTDELVYQQTTEQLIALSQNGPISMHLYETGLPAANIGFYRALADYHREKRGPQVAVLTKFYRNKKYEDSTRPWVILP